MRDQTHPRDREKSAAVGRRGVRHSRPAARDREKSAAAGRRGVRHSRPAARDRENTRTSTSTPAAASVQEHMPQSSSMPPPLNIVADIEDVIGWGNLCLKSHLGGHSLL